MALPLLLPPSLIPKSAPNTIQWTPKKYLTDPQPPPIDDAKAQEQELLAANARQFLDGKLVKKTRPRKTVDYNGGMGRWALVR